MASITPREAQQQLLAIPRPLRNGPSSGVRSIADLCQASQQGMGCLKLHSFTEDVTGSCEIDSLMLGNLRIGFGRSTPMRSTIKIQPSITCLIHYTGTTIVELDRKSHQLDPYQSIFHTNQAGVQHFCGGSGISFQLEHQHLLRTIHAVSGRDDLRLPAAGVLAQLSEQLSGCFIALFQLVDQLLRDDPRLPLALGLDEQLHRLLAFRLLEQHNQLERLERHQAMGGALQSAAALDRLIEQIHAHEHGQRPLTLTDLEALSGYSARRLQQLFRERFDCSPMRYVRRKRLEAALQRLETPEPGDSVTSIGRDFGYRRAGHFASDFQRQFGHSPASVLRAAQTWQRENRSRQPQSGAPRPTADPPEPPQPSIERVSA